MSGRVSVPKQSENATGAGWRVNLFGPFIQCNTNPASSQTSTRDEEDPFELVATSLALDPEKYKYVAIFIGANYCPHCRDFAPTVVASATALEANHQCKVLFASNDRDEENFNASLQKTAGIDAIPYNLEKTKAMRDLFGLSTIPALIIVKNDNFDREAPTFVSNGRNALVADPKAKFFPWDQGAAAAASSTADSSSSSSNHLSSMERFIISGKYGQWWELGHHINPSKPDEMYMDEHAVRARAGILNVISWIALINIFFWRETAFIKVVFPLVSIEFLASMVFGLTPFAPIGILGSLLAIQLNPEPYWKPAKPKRFAWAIGLTLATLCLAWFLLRDDLGDAYRPLIGATAMMCNVATWLESSCGFCLGCFIYNNYLVKWFDLEECQECKL